MIKNGRLKQNKTRSDPRKSSRRALNCQLSSRNYLQLSTHLKRVHKMPSKPWTNFVEKSRKKANMNESNLRKSLYLSARNSWSNFFKESALLIHEINNLKDFIRQIYFFARLSCHNKIDTYLKLKNSIRNDKCLICSVLLFGLLLCLLNDFPRSLIKLDCFSYFLKTVDFYFRYVQLIKCGFRCRNNLHFTFLIIYNLYFLIIWYYKYKLTNGYINLLTPIHVLGPSIPTSLICSSCS